MFVSLFLSLFRSFCLALRYVMLCYVFVMNTCFGFLHMSSRPLFRIAACLFVCLHHHHIICVSFFLSTCCKWQKQVKLLWFVNISRTKEQVQVNDAIWCCRKIKQFTWTWNQKLRTNEKKGAQTIASCKRNVEIYGCWPMAVITQLLLLFVVPPLLLLLFMAIRTDANLHSYMLISVLLRFLLLWSTSRALNFNYKCTYLFYLWQQFVDRHIKTSGFGIEQSKRIEINFDGHISSFASLHQMNFHSH